MILSILLAPVGLREQMLFSYGYVTSLIESEFPLELGVTQPHTSLSQQLFLQLIPSDFCLVVRSGEKGRPNFCMKKNSATLSKRVFDAEISIYC